MALLKLKFFKSWNSLILLLISLLGFSTACKEEDEARMYGSPHAYFTIAGEIKSSETQMPIPDIIIEMRHKTNVGEGYTATRLVDANFSNASGGFDVSEMSTSKEDRTYQVKFTDTDGRINGEYESLDTMIVFQDPQFINGDDSFYLGSVKKELQIHLKPKK